MRQARSGARLSQVPVRKLYFDLIGPQQDVWVWRLVDDDERLMALSGSTFRYYLEALADARKNGLDLQPSFRAAKPLTRSSQETSTPSVTRT